MPVTWAFQDEVLTVSVIGDYTFAEMRQAVADALAALGRAAVPAILFDGRSSLAVMSPDEIRARADWMASLLATQLTARCALLIGPSPYRRRLVDAGLTHLGLAGAGLTVFTDLEEARRWLASPGPRRLGATPD